MQRDIGNIRERIRRHASNRAFTKEGHEPLFLASETARIVIVGQAPGVRAQASATAWNDASGDRLMSWLGVSPEVFRDASLIAHLPMDFYYPGKGPSGDLPPRKGFAERWHPELLEHMPEVELMILIGQYAQRYYLGGKRKPTLTDTVRAYAEYLPGHFPIVHPSPLNFRWFSKNPWFEAEVVPVLRREVKRILARR